MIEINKISKKYKKKEVFNDISFDIKEGEVVALLGHNGSGKSTLMKMILGIIKPNSGYVKIDGWDSFKYGRHLMKNMGVIFNQKPSFIVDLSVYDNFEYFKAIYEISDQQFISMLELIDKYINISDLYEKQYRKMSFGERIKCEIASVLLHKPKYLFLDEPTIGLDYNAKKGLYELIKYFNREFNTTVIIVTHEVDYIQNICTRTIMLGKGGIIYDGNTNNVASYLEWNVQLKFTYNNIIDNRIACEIMHDKRCKFTSNEIVFTIDTASDKQDYIEKCCKAFDVMSFEVGKPCLREVFEHVLQEDL